MACGAYFWAGAGRTWFEGPLARCGAVRRGLSVDQAEATLRACLRSLGKAYQLFQCLGIQVCVTFFQFWVAESTHEVTVEVRRSRMPADRRYAVAEPAHRGKKKALPSSPRFDE